MRDIVEVLKEAFNRLPGTSNSDVNVLAIPVPVQWGDIDLAIAEITRLREEVSYWRNTARARAHGGSVGMP